MDGPQVAGLVVHVALVDLGSRLAGDGVLQGVGNVAKVGRHVLEAKERAAGEVDGAAVAGGADERPVLGEALEGQLRGDAGPGGGGQVGRGVTEEAFVVIAVAAGVEIREGVMVVVVAKEGLLHDEGADV